MARGPETPASIPAREQLQCLSKGAEKQVELNFENAKKELRTAMNEYLKYFEVAKPNRDEMYRLTDKVEKAFFKLGKTMECLPIPKRKKYAIEYYKLIVEIVNFRVKGRDGQTVSALSCFESPDGSYLPLGLLYYYYPPILDVFEKVLRGKRDANFKVEDVIRYMHEWNSYQFTNSDEDWPYQDTETMGAIKEYYQGISLERLGDVYRRAAKIYADNNVYDRFFKIPKQEGRPYELGPYDVIPLDDPDSPMPYTE